VDAIAYLIGAGSMSLGVEAAGFDLKAVWETPGYSKNAATWDLNRPELRHQVFELDHTSDHLARVASGVDLIYGNPPCGGLSAMTASRLSSPTNNCMRQWIRMVVKARPRMILMENAFQLATERVGCLLTDLTDVLDQHDYYWWTWIMYSYQIHTPQIRRRAFLCASLDVPKHPELIPLDDLPSSRDRSLCPVGPYLANLVGVDPSPDPVWSTTGEVVTQHWYEPIKTVELNALVKQNIGRLSSRFLTPKDRRKIQERADNGDRVAQRELLQVEQLIWEDCPREFGGMQCHRPYIIPWHEAGATIIGSYKYIHPIDHRFLTMREMARLMGYPDSWKFHRLFPHLIAQGIPVNNAWWAATRMREVMGLKD